ncbi:MAG: RNA-binding domain-containing protein [bacterium]
MALPINIQNLINQETVESERVEFKKGWNPEDCLHSICAFANDINNWGGGYIIIGIEAIDGVPILPPIGLALSELDKIQKKIVEYSYKISPSYTPIVSHEIIDGKHILIIWAPGGDNRPYQASINLGKNEKQKVYWIRKASCTVTAGIEDERKLLELASKIPFDDRVNHNAIIEDLDITLIQSYLREVKSSLFDQSSKLSFLELCRSMNIVKGPDEDVYPKNVGLLLFSLEPTKFFPGAMIEIVIYNDDIGDQLTEQKFTGPLHIQLREAINFLKNNVIKQKTIKIEGKAEAQRFYNYPFEAIEEALPNAVYHRSYEHLNSIEISVRLDRIDILSFPGPLPPLNRKLLKEERIIPRDYRNRRIGEFLKELKLTEGRGTGIPKIRRSMLLNGSSKPIFDTDIDMTYFMTTLPIHRSFLDFKLDDYKRSILEYCLLPHSRNEILTYLSLTNHSENYKRHILPLIEIGYISYTMPHIPRSSKQKYLITPVGEAALNK